MKSVICQIAWKLGTTMYFSCFILHRAGHLEKWDHLRNPSRCFFLSGRSSGTIRPLAKPFAFFYYQAGRPKQFDLFQKKKDGSSSKWLVSWFQHLSFVFEVFKNSKKKKQKFVLYLFFFINLLRKAKRKQNFLISLHSKYYKEMTTVRIQFFTLLF